MPRRRKKLTGVSISGGIVLGHARVLMPGDFEVAEITIPPSLIQSEIDSLEDAIAQTVAELRTLRESAGKKIGGPVAKIFDAQLLIATDNDFISQVKKEIRSSKRNAAFVYSNIIRRTVAPLKHSKDSYMRSMAQDIDAVTDRVISYLSGAENRDVKFLPNTILVGKSFTPGEILAYRQQKVTGFIVSEGGTDSHMALIARSLMLPVMLVNQAVNKVSNGCRIILDGTLGDVIVDPTEKECSEYEKRRRRFGPALVTRIRKLSPIPPVTADGEEIEIAANLSLPGPVDDILADKNIPVGLYRTEYLYLAQGNFPDEETQYQCYRRVAKKFTGSSVILRTFDIGYDKTTDDGSWPEEDNPALGWRGIRAMLDMTTVFKTQIRAILRASTLKNLKIMLPMVTELSELVKARRLISQTKLSLRREKIEFDNDIQVGIMVEVPAAAMIANYLAPNVDFISIGTNDLTQYTMAADRMNAKVANLYSPLHPSVLNLINMTVIAGKKHNKPVSVCGEVAGDILALPLFIGMGVHMLSMTPNRIFDLCRMVKKIDSRLVSHLVDPVISSGTLQSVRLKLENYRTELEKKKYNV